MLNYGWIIPAVPAVAFVLILFFGKHLPKKGAEIGITALGASFVLSCVAVYQWIDRVETASGGHETLRALGRSRQARAGTRDFEIARRADDRPIAHTFNSLSRSGGPAA